MRMVVLPTDAIPNCYCGRGSVPNSSPRYEALRTGQPRAGRGSVASIAEIGQPLPMSSSPIGSSFVVDGWKRLRALGPLTTRWGSRSAAHGAVPRCRCGNVRVPKGR